MKHATIIVRADWDDDANVWVATSTDINGLALEAPTFESLMKKIPGALCDLMELNGLEIDESISDIPYHVMASQVGRIPNPCY